MSKGFKMQPNKDLKSYRSLDRSLVEGPKTSLDKNQMNEIKRKM